MSFSGQADLIIYNGSLCVLKVPNTPTKKNQMINEINIYLEIKNHPELSYFTPKLFGCDSDKNFIVTEYRGTSIDKIMSFSIDYSKEATFSLLLSVIVLNSYKISRNDIHLKNITVTQLQKPVVIKLKINEDKEKYVSIRHCSSSLIDFGLAKQLPTSVISLIQKDITCCFEVIKLILCKMSSKVDDKIKK